MKKRTAAALFGLILALNVAAWAIFRPPVNTSSPQAGYAYLSPRIFADNPNDILVRFFPLRKQLETKFKALPADTQYSFLF